MIQKPPRITTFSLGAAPTIQDVMKVVKWIEKLPENSRVTFTQQGGQRDQVYTLITVTETDW